MTEALYDELDEPRRSRYEAHLSECASCRGEHERLGRVLGRLDEHQPPGPPPEYWTGFWRTLQGRITNEAARGLPLRAAWDGLRRPVFAAAAAVALVAVGFAAGWGVFYHSSGPAAVSTPSAVLASTVVPRAGRYVEQSRFVLLSLQNMEYLDGSNLSRLKGISDDLAFEAILLDEELSETDDEPLRQLVSDVAVVLMQIANAENGGQGMLRAIRMGIQQGDLLLRIDLEALGKPHEAAVRRAISGPSPTTDAQI